MSKFSKEVLAWYEQFGRKSLPWKLSSIPKKDRPYHIWLSEVMLQQTQVTTVIPYYQKFIGSFPNLETLASATQDDVLAHWSGLGYYARGRNLHKAAIDMWENFRAVPDDFDTLLALPGIGPSTAGAIMAQAFNQSYPILDGNVKRVLARYFAVEGWYGVSAVGKKLWKHSSDVTPKERVADYTQAIMDIGALVCKRSKPLCEKCPLQTNCLAFNSNRISELPTPKPKKEKPIKQAYVLCVLDRQTVYLQQRPPTGIWGGLWSFPEFDSKQKLINFLEKNFSRQSEFDTLESFRHTFSHYHLDIHPHVLQLSDKIAMNQSIHQIQDSSAKYFPLQGELEVGIAAPVKRLLEDLSQLNL